MFVERWNSIQPNKPRLFLPNHTLLQHPLGLDEGDNMHQKVSTSFIALLLYNVLTSFIFFFSVPQLLISLPCHLSPPARDVGQMLMGFTGRMGR